MAEALAALERPAEEGDLGVEAGALDRAGADQRAGAAQRLPLLAVDPELERRPPLDAVRRRTRSRAGPRRPRPGRRRGRRGPRRAPRRRARAAPAGRFAVSASSPPSEKTIPIDRRTGSGALLAHGRGDYLCAR